MIAQKQARAEQPNLVLGQQKDPANRNGAREDWREDSCELKFDIDGWFDRAAECKQRDRAVEGIGQTVVEVVEVAVLLVTDRPEHEHDEREQDGDKRSEFTPPDIPASAPG